MNDIVARLAQANRHLGFIPRDEMNKIAREYELPAARVFGTATFYSLFRTRPRGVHIVRFCQDAPCHVAGGRAVLDSIRNALNLEPGQTSEDGQWTFEMTSCLGVCGVGPVMMVDDNIYGNVTPEGVAEILLGTRQGAPKAQ